MTYSVNISVEPNSEKNELLIKSLILKQLKAQKNFVSSDILRIKKITFVKKSIDARHGKIKFNLKYEIFCIDESNAEISSQKVGLLSSSLLAKNHFDSLKIEDISCNSDLHSQENVLPQWKTANPKKTVVIVGCGPAGLFAALKLLESGVMPIIVEQGPRTSARKIDIANISKVGKVNEYSNYCFGEGGAGTFSDGKLFTRSNKRGNIAGVLQIFHYFGAKSDILTDAHPHIGTDKLPKIINAMVNKIISLGGQVFFSTVFCNLIVEKKQNIDICKGIEVFDLETMKKRQIIANNVILATGHSASQVYETLFKLNPKSLEAKNFAIGVRLEHPREIIDKIQYHGVERGAVLPTAEYRLTTQVDGRGVYSFCMCPGGFVVPSASSDTEIVVNGMSSSGRNSAWSNAAIVAEVKTSDLAAEVCGENSVLAGLKFRTKIEQLARKETGLCKLAETNPQVAPAQKLVDFLAGKLSTSLPKTSYIPGVCSSRLDKWLPPFIVESLKKAFYAFNKNMKGLICEEALLIAPETRTSTPVRILRDKETLESPVFKNLFPCGEGSGYAGGIVSSAMDGEKVAVQIISRLNA